MRHYESLCPPFEGVLDVGHDFLARQCREVREESRVDQQGKREAEMEGKSEMHQCIHREMDAYWGGAERNFQVEWHNIRGQALAPGRTRIGCPGLE